MAISIITTNARRDIQQAIDWENTWQSGLGESFLDFLNLKLQTLSNTPFIGSARYDNVRCTTTDVFQYLIHYVVDLEQSQITVLRVLHRLDNESRHGYDCCGPTGRCVRVLPTKATNILHLTAQ